MDIASVLVRLTASGQIESRTALDAALLELLECVARSNDDIPWLLSVIANGTPGLLEAVLTSCNHNAFTFRSRMAKSIRKSIAAATPVFRTCTGRLGLFLISLPPSVARDRRVMEDYNALTSAAVIEDSVEYENSVAKRDRPEQKSPTRSSRRSEQLSTTGLTSPLSKKGIPKSDRTVKLPASSESPIGDDNPSSNRPKLLASFLENFFASCIREDIEEFAVNNLLRNLTSNDGSAPSSAAPPVASERQDHVSTSITSDALSRPLHHLELKEEDIANYLNQTPKLKSGDWPVVVSQRGIKQLREYLPSRKDVFLGIEKKIKQLSVGFFPSQNRFKLLEKDFGIPIYVADLGDNLQLIYHIDFGAPTVTAQESQFIRVFGVYLRSEVDKRFWTSVAAQLARRGQEYIKRCTDREETRIRFKRVETTPPKLFSALSASQWFKDGADIHIDKAHFLELHRVLAKTTCMQFRMLVLEKAAQNSGRPLRQMFVTQSRMLANRVQQYWNKLQQKEGDTEDASRRKSSSSSSPDLDEDAEDEVLPPKFSQLDDSHFPLFVTYNQLCKLLEADYDLQFNPSADAPMANLRARRAGKPIRQPFVSFEFFQSNIWPRLDEIVKKGLNPANVYGEFLGVIKGSELAFMSSKRQLDRETYESQSSRTHAGDYSERSRVYTLFESYMKKRPPSSYDMADRAHAIIAQIQESGVPGRGVDFIYVDEAQDHLMVDVAVLRSLCQNPHGLFVAGDTAQTISLGSAFRFNELKAFLYRLEVKNISSSDAVDPEFFQLSVNYRCHSGIVKAAAFLVQLIVSYFAYSIDPLIPEASPVDVSDQKPMFMLGAMDDSDFLRLVSGGTGGNVELGADQGKRLAIIVRDDNAARKLQAIVGDIPGLLTLYQSKGLEFDEVVMYNFFADSPATDTDWRAIHHSQRYGKSFDDQKHSILRRELKSLYVGLTRARERIWIWDESMNGGELEAAACFKNAGMAQQESVCQAYSDRQIALGLAQGHQSRVDAFSKAAKAFEHLASGSQSPVNSKGQRRFFINAAECYAAIMHYTSAAGAFIKARKYTEAAHHYRLSDQFEEALEVIRQHPIDQGVSEYIIYDAKLFYAWDLCGSKNDFLDFLKTHGFHEQRVAIHDSLKEYEQAGDIRWDGGKYVLAVDLFCRENSASSRRKATECLLEGLRANISFANGYGKRLDMLSELFERRKDVELSQDEVDEIDLLQDVATWNSGRLKERRWHLRRSGNAIHELFVFDAFIWSGILESVQTAKEEEVLKILGMCRAYDSLVKKVVQMPGILEKQVVQYMFGVSIFRASYGVQQEIISVKCPSFAHSALSELTLRSINEAKGIFSVPVSKLDLTNRIRHALLTRLNQLISNFDDLARRSRAFRLCASFLVMGKCDDASQAQCWKDHLPETNPASTCKTFNSQLRLHISMMSFLDQDTGLGKNGARTRREKLRKYLRETLKGLRPPTNSKRFLDDILMTSLLATAFDYIPAASYLDLDKQREELDKNLPDEQKKEKQRIDTSFARELGLLHPETQRPLVKAVLDWCTQKSTNSMEEAISFLQLVLTGKVWLDIEVAVAFIEEVCGQLIFSYKMHHANDSRELIMPRSWVMRAFSRCPSLPPRDEKVRVLVESLSGFIGILSLREDNDDCRLRVEGASLKDNESLTTWNLTSIRAGRCLALIGHNIPRARDLVLNAFNSVVDCPFVATVLEDKPAALGWNHIFKALKSASSDLDRLLVVNLEEAGTSGVHALARDSAPRPLASQSHIPPHSSAAPSLTTTIQREHSNWPAECEGDPNNLQVSSKTSLESRPFFKRHQSAAGGPIVTTLENVIKLRIPMSEVCADDRFLAFYLQGLLRHAIAYLERVQDKVNFEIKAFGDNFRRGGRKEVRGATELSDKMLKLREIRDHAKKIVDKLLPTSDFRFDGTSRPPAPISDILENVNAIPGLVEILRPFATLPDEPFHLDDIDEKHNVVPILKYLAYWTEKGAISERSIRH
ncbi:hypothetical protein FRC00_000926 [Tulasnella sp. 408]|nr:hypothetical protein FRC00_000926 [Tulasnella sp. 408]